MGLNTEWENMDVSHLDSYKKLIYQKETIRLRQTENRLRELLYGPAITLEDIEEESPKKERIKLFKK